MLAVAVGLGDVVHRAELVSAAWPDGSIVHDNTLDAWVVRLRHNLRGAGPPATARRGGFGYAFG